MDIFEFSDNIEEKVKKEAEEKHKGYNQEMIKRVLTQSVLRNVLYILDKDYHDVFISIQEDLLKEII